MYRIEGKLVGVADLLFNKFTEAAEESLRTGNTGGKKTDEERLVEAMGKYYFDEQGLYWPAWNFKRCLLNGADKANLKEGRKNLSGFLAGTVFPDDPLRFNKGKPDFVHEVTGNRPPRTGGACLIKRPALVRGWELTFGLTVTDDRRSADAIHKALIEAGMLVGMGSWRPEYGRFTVAEWRVIKPEVSA